MVNNMRKYEGYLLAVLLLLCALNACNFKQNDPDTTQNAHADKGKITQIMPAITDQQPQHFNVSPEQLGKMGEPVGAMDVQNGEAVTDALFYTINKATMFENIEEAGIDPDAMFFLATDDLLGGSGKLKPSVKFMLIEVTVQNVRAEPDRNITDLNILCADTVSVSADNSEASFFEIFPSEPAYFSNPTGKRIGDDWKEYYNYSLPVGQRKKLNVGWYVDTEQYDPQNLYVSFCYDEYKKYVKIVF